MVGGVARLGDTGEGSREPRHHGNSSEIWSLSFLGMCRISVRELDYIQRQKRYPKELLRHKDFAELSGELSGEIFASKPLFYWVVPSNC